MDDDIALLDRFFAAIEAGDEGVLEACYADDVVVWNNVARAEATKAENLALLRWWHGRVEGLRYEVLERLPFDGGVVQRHVVQGRVGDVELDVPCCIVFRIVAGRITDLREYLDQAAVSPAFAR